MQTSGTHRLPALAADRGPLAPGTELQVQRPELVYAEGAADADQDRPIGVARLASLVIRALRRHGLAFEKGPVRLQFLAIFFVYDLNECGFTLTRAECIVHL